MARLRVLLAFGLAMAFIAPASVMAQAQEATVPGEFVAAFNTLDVQFDPHHSIYSAEAELFTAIYEGLFTYDPQTLDPVKSACRSFTKAKDGLTYTFRIREDAVWSDGSPLLASDFRDAWLRAISPREKADYASFFDVIAGARDYRNGKSRNPNSVGIAVLDDRVLQVKLASPAPYFTRLLCHHSFSPVHPSMLKNKDWAAAIPFPVNGPYVVSSYDGKEIILDRNEKYWDRDSVAIPRVRILLSDDDTGMTARFDAGEVHWLEGPMDFDTLVDRQAIQYSPMFGTQYWYFDCKTRPWNNPNVRRALALLLPWDEIRSEELYLLPAPTLVLPYSGYEKAAGITERNEKEALDLLAKAGYAEGKGLPEITILVPEGGEDAARVSSIMKKYWEKLADIHVNVESIPAEGYYLRVRQGPIKGRFTLGLTTWIGDFADPLAFLGMFASDSNLNDAKYSDPEYDRLLQVAARKDGSERLDALAEAENRLLSTAAVMPLYHNLATNIVDTDYVLGWYPNVLDLHPFKYLSFGQRSVRPNVASLPSLPASPDGRAPATPALPAGAGRDATPFVSPAALSTTAQWES